MRIYHGTILSMDAENGVYDYLVEDRGRIVHVGHSLPAEYENTGETVKLGERALLPAFGDGHMHFSNWALIAVSSFDVREAVDIGEIQDTVRDFLARHGKEKAVIAFGASRHSVKEKRLIERQELDAACPEKPLIIICYDGHSAVCNTRMVEKLPDRVRELRGFYGEKGHLFNEAYLAGTDYATSMVPPMDLVRSIIKSYDLLAQNGIGLIHATEGIGFPRDLDITLVSWLARARAHASRFSTRIYFQTMAVEKALKRRLPRIGGCFATALDGCFGACDAALHAPYRNDPDNRGILFQTEAEVMEFAKTANRAGLQIQMHAIGDAAVSRAVSAIKAALSDCPREDHRHTIIHACLMAPEDLEAIARLGIGITLQPGFMVSPLEPPEYLHEILGARVSDLSPLKTMLDAGVHVSGGSDAPVTHPDPIDAIFGACNHPYDPGQSVSVMDALKMMTREVARTAFDDTERGSLETGKIADMVVLNRNPLAMDRRELRSLKVEQLYLSGKPYESGMGLAGALWHGWAGRGEKI